MKGSYKIENVKAMITDKTSIPSDQLWLYHGGKKLEDGLSLDECNISIGSILSVLVMHGGMFIFV